MADLCEMMPMKLLSFARPVFQRLSRQGVKVMCEWLVAFGLMGLLLVDGRAEAPASHGKTPPTAPSANASKLQAWKDAEAIAALAPGRSEVIGAGDSMKPVYGENTILVLSKISYDELKPGMNVVYTNRRAKLVVHQTLARETKGWRVQGINNEREDPERVTRDNLVGVVYASLSYSDGSEKSAGDTSKPK
ncbi:S24/S26 family peptidase [Nibricoccus aquaticus]|nr:S24/S26 family peptidase [Nibricoccus aquaticus]